MAGTGAVTGGGGDPEEVAWRTAVEAAPRLVGDADPQARTGPEELYETLKPFEDMVVEDINESGGDSWGLAAERAGPSVDSGACPAAGSSR